MIQNSKSFNGEIRGEDRQGGTRQAQEVSSGRIELIATSLEVLEGWVVGLNYLARINKE